MRTLALLCFTLISQTSFAGLKVVYGEDNRRDIYQTTNPIHLQVARASAGMIHKDKLTPSLTPGLFNIYSALTLEIGQNVCSTEAFAQQRAAMTCSGFLVADDVLVTAGHCFRTMSSPAQTCRDYAWVFDYSMTSETHDPTKGILAKNVYNCRQVLRSALDSELDYAIIWLDRPVKDREPLKFRDEGKVADDASLMVVGHPSGIPTKISDGGRVTRNNREYVFSTTVDTFQGNSGSAVVDARTGLLEGILIQGKSDYRPSVPGDMFSCRVVNQCDDDAQNCSAGFELGPVSQGELVFRITTIAELLESYL